MPAWPKQAPCPLLPCGPLHAQLHPLEPLPVLDDPVGVLVEGEVLDTEGDAPHGLDDLDGGAMENAVVALDSALVQRC